MGIKDQILAADDLPSRKVTVKEWGTTVVVRTMDGESRDSWEVSVFTGDVDRRRENIRAKLLVRTLFDEAGQPVFTNEDVASLGKKSSRILERLYDVAAKLNGIRDGDIAELEKNS
jgi:hypothetical protein